MVKAKRQRKYSFTVTQKKTAEWKQALADKVRQFVHMYDRMIVFKFVNPRTDLIQDLRKKFRRSKFFLGKNKVLQIGLGRTEEEEVDTNLHMVASEMVGQRGILFTNESVEHVLNFFNDHSVKVHSRPGNLAPSTVKLEPGLLDGFSHNQEPLLRKLGLTTRLKVVAAGTGIPELLVPYTVCVKGKRLKPNQATLLRLLGYKESNFSVRLYCLWVRSSGDFQKFIMKDGKMKLRRSQDGDDSEDEMTSDDDIDDENEEEDDDMQVSDGLDDRMMLTEEHEKMMNK